MNKHIISTLLLASLGTSVSANDKIVNFSMNLLAPWSVSGSIKVLANAEIGASFASYTSHSSSSWGEPGSKDYQSIELPGETRGYGAFVQLTPNQALTSGPLLRLELSYLDRDIESAETDVKLFDENVYFTCNYQTQTTSSSVMVGYQWISKVGLNAAISTGYQHHWTQSVDSQCSNNDPYLEGYYRELLSPSGSAQIAARVGWAF